MSVSAYAAQILSLTPAAFWKCQEASGSLVDSGGGGHDLTSLSGTIDYRDPGPFGSDYSVRLHAGAAADRAFFDSTMNNISCEAWFQVVSAPAGSNCDIFFNAQSDGVSAGIAGWSLEVASSLKFRVVVQSIAFETDSPSALPSPSSGSGNKLLPLLGVGGGSGVAAWTLVSVVRAAGTWKYYVNGVAAGTHGTDTPNNISGPNALVGFQSINGDNRYAYVSYFTSALSATDVANNYAAALS